MRRARDAGMWATPSFTVMPAERSRSSTYGATRTPGFSISWEASARMSSISGRSRSSNFGFIGASYGPRGLKPAKICPLDAALKGRSSTLPPQLNLRDDRVRLLLHQFAGEGDGGHGVFGVAIGANFVSPATRHGRATNHHFHLRAQAGFFQR